MIELTRLNGHRLAVNSDLILFAESAPDTLLTMVTGEKLIVKETLAEVAGRMVAYRACILAEASRLSPDGIAPCSGAALQVMAAKSAKDAMVGDDIDEAGTAAMRRRRMEFQRS